MEGLVIVKVYFKGFFFNLGFWSWGGNFFFIQMVRREVREGGRGEIQYQKVDRKEENEVVGKVYLKGMGVGVGCLKGGGVRFQGEKVNKQGNGIKLDEVFLRKRWC